MPVDDVPAIVPEGEPLLEEGEQWDRPEEVKRLLENNHFITCPWAGRHRKPKRQKEAPR